MKINIIPFYLFFSYLLIPFVKILLHKRLKNKQEDAERFQERYGKASIKRSDGKLIWIHAASVGETLSLQPFIKWLKNENPQLSILLTTTTVTGAHVAYKQYGDICIHQYIPFDISIWIKRFLNHWKPDVAFFVESEIWPGILYHLRKKKIPAILLNARISYRSFKRWNLLKPIASQILSYFHICFAQSDETENYLKSLGIQNVERMPHLKYAAEPLPVDENLFSQINEGLKKRPCWIASSTHEGEEEIINKADTKLRKDVPNLFTFIAPRHPHRAEEVLKIFHKRGKKFILLSQFEGILSHDCKGMIIDKIGVLGTFYTLADVVFCGGSFKPIGGHNPIEPALFKKPVFWGPYIHNFQEVCEALSSGGGEVKNIEELIYNVKRCLENEAERNLKGENAFKCVKKISNTLNDFLNKKIKKYL